MKKSIIIILASLALAACSTSQTKKNSASHLEDDLRNDLVVGLLKSKFEKNASSLLCGQKAYTSCFNITQEQCMEELASAQKQCVGSANEKLPANPTEKDIKTYGARISMCLALKHMLNHPTELQSIAACLKDIDKKMDKAAGMKSLLQ